MNAPPPTALPRHLQPAKAAAVAQTSQLSATADNSPAGSRASSQNRVFKARQDAPKSDFASPKATTSLIRRVLAPDTTHGSDPRASPEPVEGLLPPLTSSNEVDFQLYAIIAIIVKDSVSSWYSKITPDHTLVEEVIQIIAHCSRALEQRLRQTEIQELVFDEIPALLDQHIQAYRVAQNLSNASVYAAEPLQIYHTLNPHPALSPLSGFETDHEQHISEATYRQLLVQSALAVLLPTEDLENACTRTLVADILADLILGQIVAGKVCDGWFLNAAITKVVGIVKAHVQPKVRGEELQSDTRSRLEQFGLLSSRSQDEEPHSSKNHQSRSSALFWRIMQYGYLFYVCLRFIILGMSQARYLPKRTRLTRPSPSSPVVPRTLPTSTLQRPRGLNTDRSPRPVLMYRIFPAISTILDLSTRMPWLGSSLAFCQHFVESGPGRLGSANTILDRFLHHTIHTYVLPPSLLPPVLLNLRTTLFPNNSLGPPAPPSPSPVEQLAIRRMAAEEILSLIPPIVARIFFATAEPADWVRQVEEILNVFGDRRMNKYLIYGIVELVLVRLIPEMEEKGWSELLAERGVPVESLFETESEVDLAVLDKVQRRGRDMTNSGKAISVG